MSPIEKRKNQPQLSMNTFPSKGSMHNSYHNPAFFKIQLPEVLSQHLLISNQSLGLTKNEIRRRTKSKRSIRS